MPCASILGRGGRALLKDNLDGCAGGYALGAGPSSTGATAGEDHPSTKAGAMALGPGLGASAGLGALCHMGGITVEGIGTGPVHGEVAGVADFLTMLQIGAPGWAGGNTGCFAGGTAAGEGPPPGRPGT